MPNLAELIECFYCLSRFAVLPGNDPCLVVRRLFPLIRILRHLHSFNFGVLTASRSVVYRLVMRNSKRDKHPVVNPHPAGDYGSSFVYNLQGVMYDDALLLPFLPAHAWPSAQMSSLHPSAIDSLR